MRSPPRVLFLIPVLWLTAAAADALPPAAQASAAPPAAGKCGAERRSAVQGS